MATAPSKRKKPLREDFMLKEVRKIESEVFDRPTLLVLSRMMKKGVIATVDFPISTGKEANVFRATAPAGGFLAVKIYKIETAPFFRKLEYLEGDPRFKQVKYRESDLVFAFARKEFKNLQVCEAAGVHAPKPFYVERNVVVMGFLGEDGLPYPTMNTVAGPLSMADLESILEDIRCMYRAGIVHADISEYNLLRGDVPYLIDFGQGVAVRHPHAGRFLERDVFNILHYFERHGIRRDLKKTLEWIRG